MAGAHHHELHGASLAHTTRRIRPSVSGAQRLGAGPKQTAAYLLAFAARASWGHLNREAFRRGHVRPRRDRTGTQLRRDWRAATRILTRPPSILIIKSLRNETLFRNSYQALTRSRTKYLEFHSFKSKRLPLSAAPGAFERGQGAINLSVCGARVLLTMLKSPVTSR